MTHSYTFFNFILSEWPILILSLTLYFQSDPLWSLLDCCTPRVRQFGIRNNGHTAYWSISEWLFNFFTLSADRFILLTVTSPHNLAQNKGERLKRWRSERMQAPYKEQKATNVVHLSLYFNMLSCRFTIIAFSLDKAFEWLAAHRPPCTGEKERGLLIKNWCIFLFWRG